ncbi:unnamed protein product [Eruca vesicaria subsp. sativa]|uniref:Uncharacterized protein n=1 Tax=Eruca vesicaria subsp. sativa TaxID=29727 RepID=A0ABC8J671_ERUVS|nr:unnamed protein product [Eruca vesicaria subsp. sativa]
MMSPVKKTSAIRPVEFYGNALPRPRFFDNPKFNSHRVDPPLSVLDPLLSWAREAHWSMGGLNFTRLRLQGRIEGNVDKLRAQLENSTPVKIESGDSDRKKRRSEHDFDSPPAAPVAVKRRRYIDLNDDVDDEEEGIGSEDEGVARIRRKLSDDFDRVAGESKINVVVKANKKSIELGSDGKRLKEKKKTSSTRTSPRLVKLRSSS